MRKLIIWNVVTVDGCFEGRKPWDLEFHNLVWGPEVEALSIEQLREADMLVFGKNTYKGMAEYWPKADATEAKVATLMNSIKKIVCSRTLEKAEWNNTTIIRDAARGLRTLKEEGDRPMYIFGSAMLSESLLNAGLVDEIRLCIAPTILGNGRRFFTNGFTARKLKLLESRPLANGGVILRYQVVNK